MRHKIAFRLAMAAVCIIITGCAEDPGREWNALKLTEASLVFSAPELDGTTKRFIRSEAGDYSHSTELGIWSSSVMAMPKAHVALLTLSPGYVYTRNLDLEAYIRRLKFVHGKSLAIGIKLSTETLLGKITYRSFSFGEFECMAFGHNFGEFTAGNSSRDLNRVNTLIGFYCGDPGMKLLPDEIARVGRSLGVKGAGS